MVPFAILSKTAFIAERPLGWVVGSGVRLMVLTLVLGVGNNIFQSLQVPVGQTVTTYEAFCIALAALLLMVLSLVASRLATDMVIGGPSLGVSTALNTTAVAVNTTASAATSAGQKSITALKAVTAAAALPVKGVSLAASAGAAAVRTMTGSGGRGAAGSGAVGSAAGSVQPASNVPKSNASPKSPSSPTNAGGKTT